MDNAPESHCKDQYNVGVLDGVGVAILWFNVLRWAVLITFNDDINILLSFLTLDSVAILCIPGPDLLLLITSSLAIGYGTDVRAVGIAGIVFVCILLCCGCQSTTEFNGVVVQYIGPVVFFYGILYPTLMACYITLIVRDHNQWIPRPQTTLEYVLLGLRTASGSGAMEILSVMGKKIYHFFRPPPADTEYLIGKLRWWGLEM
ncbi:hypothetical protein BGZ73_000548 [Actinomortierella ambigua]|nr:hypothetical protein BGZ73_000548 [Actinomortierella ambigua]